MIYAIHPVGKLTVTPEGAYLRFHAEAPQAAGLLRLWLSGCGELGADGAARRQAGIGSPPEPAGAVPLPRPD